MVSVSDGPHWSPVWYMVVPLEAAVSLLDPKIATNPSIYFKVVVWSPGNSFLGRDSPKSAEPFSWSDIEADGRGGPALEIRFTPADLVFHFPFGVVASTHVYCHAEKGTSEILE